MIARRAAISSSSLWRHIESYRSKMNLNLTRWVSSSSGSGSRDTGGRTADPNIYAGRPEGVDEEQAVRGATARNPQPSQKHSPDDDVTNPVKFPHSIPTLKSTGTNPPIPNQTGQQKRSFSSSSPVCSAGPAVDDDTYDKKKNDAAAAAVTTQTDRSELEDNKEYFSHNKPSPLSEIEVADTRKPLTQATDGTATNDAVGGGGKGKGKGEGEYFKSGWGESVWRPEQLESADETMERAMELWKWNKITGADLGDAPHSRILRQLRGE